MPLVAPGLGHPDFGSEDLLTYEIGYQVSLHPRLSSDCAVCYSEYNHLETVVVQPVQLEFSDGPPPRPYLVLPLTFSNDLSGETYGGEVLALWQPWDHWRLRAAYTYLQMQLHTRGSVSSFSETGLCENHPALLRGPSRSCSTWQVVRELEVLFHESDRASGIEP